VIFPYLSGILHLNSGAVGEVSAVALQWPRCVSAGKGLKRLGGVQEPDFFKGYHINGSKKTIKWILKSSLKSH
jgi:hypothetical protein